MNKEKLLKLKSIFKVYPEVSLAYIFGSIASGKAGKNSDIDIAVLLDKKLTKRKLFQIRLNLMGDISKVLKMPADVVIINNISALFFKYIIVREGINIFKRVEEEKIDFESKMLSQYFDFEPFLFEYNKNYVKNNI